MMTRRTIPGKLLVIKVNEPEGIIKKLEKKTEVVRSMVVLAGRAPEDENQIEDGMIVQHTMGGQKVTLDDMEHTLIGWEQILYVEL